MSRWSVKRLADLTDKIGSGATPRGGESSYKSNGVPLIRSMNVYDLRFDRDGLAFIDAAQAAALDNVAVQKNDVLINITGASVARCCEVPTELVGARVNQHVAIVRPRSGTAVGRFLSYLLVSREYKSRLLSLASVGGTREALTKAGLERFEIPCPPFEEQVRIASILGAYDDLIEVNRQRIGLLEEMARRLFEEWFVRFRFPGHEGHATVETTEGPLPKGWEWRSLADVCAQPNGIQTGPFGSQLHQADYVDQGVPVVMPMNMVGLRITKEKIAHVSEQKADELGRHRMKTGDVAYGRRGDIGRRAYISSRENGWFCGTGCLRLRPDITRIGSRYFFDALGHSVTLGAIRARAQGATMPNLSAGAMSGVPIMVPPLTLQREYDEIAGSWAEFSASLIEANTNLGAQRELLLPRLISGELSVADAERELEEAA